MKICSVLFKKLFIKASESCLNKIVVSLQKVCENEAIADCIHKVYTKSVEKYVYIINYEFSRT